MNRFTKLVVTIVALGLASAAFAGIAGAGSTLNKKQFLKEGNSICKAVNKDIESVFEEAFVGVDEDNPPTAEQIQTAAGNAVPLFEDAISQIDALEGPASLETKVDAVLELYRDAIAEVVADPAAAFDEDGPDVFAKADKAAKKVGLKTCAQG